MRPFQPVHPTQGLPSFTIGASSRKCPKLGPRFYVLPMTPDRGCAMKSLIGVHQDVVVFVLEFAGFLGVSLVTV